MSNYYDVDGQKLCLSEDHARTIGARLWEWPSYESPLDRPADKAPKSEWVAWAKAHGVSFAEDKTVAELKALDL